MGNLYRFLSSQDSGLKRQQTLTMVGLGLLFIVVYGACNMVTSLRNDVGTLYFQWESVIPFVPILIIPYMSIDLFFVGAPFLCKSPQELRLLTKRILAPWLVCQQMSLWHYRQQCDAWNPILPNLWIGRLLTIKEANQAIAQGVVATLDLTCAFSEARPLREKTHYKNLAVLDLTAPSQEALLEAAIWIHKQMDQDVVYLHCKIGYSRSVSVAVAYLLWSRQAASVDAAFAAIKAVRPQAVIRPEIKRAIENFYHHLDQKDTAAQIKKPLYTT